MQTFIFIMGGERSERDMHGKHVQSNEVNAV